MRILIVANHYVACSARYATAAFQRLGHEVRHVGPAMGRRIWGLDLPPGLTWEPDLPLGAYVHWLGWIPDLIIVMDTDPAILDLGLLSEAAPQYSMENVPKVVWTVDNHVRDVRRPHFNYYFLAHRNVSMMDWEDTYRPLALSDNGSTWVEETTTVSYGDMTHLPCCYDPTLHTPSPIAYEDREYDVCMIGVMYPARWQLVKELRAAGLKVLAGTGLVGEAYRDAYHNARISLCMSAAGDVAQRIFETAAMGCVVMSDNCPDFDRLKPDGLFIYEPENMVRDAQIILSQPEVAKEAIRRSIAWVEGQSWDSRAQVIVDWHTKEMASERTATQVP